MVAGEGGLRAADDAGDVVPGLLIVLAGVLGPLRVRPALVRRGGAHPSGVLLGLLKRGWKILLLQLLGLQLIVVAVPAAVVDVVEAAAVGVEVGLVPASPTPAVIAALGATPAVASRGARLAVLREAFVAQLLQLDAIFRGVGVYLVEVAERAVVPTCLDELGGILQSGGPIQAMAEDLACERAV